MEIEQRSPAILFFGRASLFHSRALVRRRRIVASSKLAGISPLMEDFFTPRFELSPFLRAGNGLAHIDPGNGLRNAGPVGAVAHEPLVAVVPGECFLRRDSRNCRALAVVADFYMDCAFALAKPKGIEK